MILWFMATQSVERLELLRASYHFLDVKISRNQCDFVRDACSSNVLYDVARNLYQGLYRPTILDLNYLQRLARHCSIAEQLAIALAARLQSTRTRTLFKRLLPKTPLDTASYNRFIRKLVPYVIALGNFLERYRDGLASFVPDPANADSVLTQSDGIERSILKNTYDRKSAYFICALYHMLRRIVDKHCFSRKLWRTETSMINLLDLQGVQRSGCTDIFIFGGLEAVKDFMLDNGSPLGKLHDHFARACPSSITRYRNLPPSALPTLDRATIARICRLFPPVDNPNMRVETLLSDEDDIGHFSEGDEIRHFYEYLISYSTDEPKLMPRNTGSTDAMQEEASHA